MGNYAETKATIGEKMNALKEEMRVLGKTFFKEESETIFHDFPDLASFSWNQYTPYFNDGDECIFHVHSDYGLAATKLDGSDYENEYGDTYLEPPYSSSSDTEVNRLTTRISDLIGSIDEGVMKSLFGDHVEVTVKRDGTIDVDEYSHD